MDIETQPGVMGAIATGIDLTKPVPDPERVQLNAALMDCHLLCIRGQDLSPHQFAAAARLFGTPQIQLLDVCLTSAPLGHIERFAQGEISGSS